MSGEPLVYDSRIAVPYAWAAGAAASRFLKSLRDEKKILALRCPSCRKVCVPPRRTCGSCFKDCEEWLEVGPRGKLLSFTQAFYDSPGQPGPRPIFGLIRLNCADTAFLHLLGGAPLEAFSAGMTVEAVFAEKRSGSILDIAHFRPV